MRLDLDRVRTNVLSATTEDLLDRATTYRDGMEPEALDLIEQELWRRGLTANDLEIHAEVRRRNQVVDAAGLPYRCARCQRPAVWSCWRWHRLFGYVPLFPRWMRLCEEHALKAQP